MQTWQDPRKLPPTTSARQFNIDRWIGNYGGDNSASSELEPRPIGGGSRKTKPPASSGHWASGWRSQESGNEPPGQWLAYNSSLLIRFLSRGLGSRLPASQPQIVLGLTPHSFANCWRVFRDLSRKCRIFCPMVAGASVEKKATTDGSLLLLFGRPVSVNGS